MVDTKRVNGLEVVKKIPEHCEEIKDVTLTFQGLDLFRNFFRCMTLHNNGSVFNVHTKNSVNETFKTFHKDYLSHPSYNITRVSCHK